MAQPLKLRLSHRISAQELNTLITRLSSFQLDMTSPMRRLTLDSFNRALSQARSLLQRLPSHLDEVRRRSAPSSLFELRIALFALIDSDALGCDEADQLAPLLRVLGVQELERPLSLWLEGEWCIAQSDRHNAHTTRVERGLAALFHSARGHELFESLSGEERIRLSGPWVRPMMRLAGRDRFPKQALLALYQSTDPNDRDALIQQFERCRRRVHARPLPTYELLIPALTFAELSLLFAYWASHDELEAVAPHMKVFSETVQQLFSSMLTSERQVS